MKLVLELEILVFGVTLLVGVMSGLLGIGGGIILTPLLLYLPPAAGLAPLDMKAVAGLTMVQSLLAAASGVIRHQRYGFVDRSVVIYMGSAIAGGSFLGAVLSHYMEAYTIQALFAGLATVAAGLLLFNTNADEQEEGVEKVAFNRPLAIAVAALVGVMGGIVGQGGAFILVPLMLHVLHLPTRITLGSSLGIVLFSSISGVVGKLGTCQVDLYLAAFLVAGAVPGAQLGGYLSRRVSTVRLRKLLTIIILVTAIKMWYELWRA